MSRSRAWREALKSRVEVHKLMRLAKDQSDQLEKDRLISDQESCLRLAMVVLIGQFQSYVSDLLNELCDTLPQEWGADMPLFQKKYALIQLHRRLSFLLTERREGDLVDDADLEKFRKEVLDCTEWLTAPISLASSGYKEDLRGFLKDNGSKSLSRAISQFGANQLNFSDWLDKNHPQYRGIFEQLDNAIQVRNDVAHGRVKQRITIRDARVYIHLVYRLMLKADEYLEPFISQQIKPVVNDTAGQQNSQNPDVRGVVETPQDVTN